MIMIAYFGLITFIFGLVLGSFLNCTAMRIVKKENWVKGRSHCINCGHDLGAKDLIPLISYLQTGGRCRYCKKKISIRYPLTELIFGFLSLFMYMAVMAPEIAKAFSGNNELLFGSFLVFIRNIVLTGALFVIALVDLEIQEVPNGCLIVGVLAFLLTTPFICEEDWIKWIGHRILAAILTMMIIILIVVIMERVLKKQAMGGGDIKLYALLALYLGYAGSYEVVLLSCIIGIIFVAVRKVLFPEKAKEFPFAPSIALAGYLMLIFSEIVTDWYFSLFI
ncbi:leader peptidase (prepilin peptidase) / N-methyltransferase [Butyrivibrio hungatei DSM 14810]|uniref:Leader peptidase (Prepilin peptidase) / N-methyltransferase n=2 Tax=Butyrivibrio hungatei TaxID=185008 RepID=A0A1M7S7J9_9FIRM|nr:leader peptidase (prepilin peptidase) / N-methyltransferase [Butyrivibrio hungatei DSM 14810]